MISPVPANTRVSSSFGNRVHPITGALKFHNGTDYVLPVGVPLISPESGVVSGWIDNQVGGKQMLIEHDNGYRSGYAHLESRLKREGQRVQAGEVIAKSGDSGNVTGAHLHFTLKNPAGDYINPESVNWQQGTITSSFDAWKLLGGIVLIYGVYRLYKAEQ